MQIELSKAEYRTLLGVLEIADWVLFAHRSDKPSDRKEYHEFEQKIFACADTFGFGHLIEYVEMHRKYFPTAEYEENSPVRAFIDEFEDHNFWTELVDRLAMRDMFRELGPERVQAMDVRERLTRRLDYENRYDEEFQRHGLERLAIRE
jgi:hypothetical protein